MTESEIFVFGDSLSDTGNSFAVTTELTGGLFSIPPSPPYSNGRASNGALALEILADVCRSAESSSTISYWFDCGRFLFNLSRLPSSKENHYPLYVIGAYR
jgi:phospholipase/lecithinase/hemolysin